MRSALRSLLYAAIFYSATVLWVLAGLIATLIGQKPTFAVVLSWVKLHHRLTRYILGINLRVEGELPAGPLLIAVKHQSMFETLEMMRLSNLPIIVMKKELADIPLFGFMTRRFGSIPVERRAGAKALRNLVEQGRHTVSTGRPVVIYPEGTRVKVGETPPLKSGFAALYRALGLPVVPVAVDSGRLWGRGFVHESGTVNFKIGPAIPPGLSRKDIESRVHAAINVLESGTKARS